MKISVCMHACMHGSSYFLRSVFYHKFHIWPEGAGSWTAALASCKGAFFKLVAC